MKALRTTHVPMWVADEMQIPRSALRESTESADTRITRLDNRIPQIENVSGDSRASQAWANDAYATLLRERDLLVMKNYRATHGATRGPAMTATERKRLAALEVELWQRACEEAGL